MTQPKFAPIGPSDEVRPSYYLEPPRRWVKHRPGELPAREVAPGHGRGAPGPDQGYALGLAELLRPRLVLSGHEAADDVLAGAVAIGLRRASLFGRAPVLSDLELALGLFGFLSDAPAELREHRRPMFAGVAHDYWRQRLLAESVPEAALRERPAEVLENGAGWRQLLGLS